MKRSLGGCLILLCTLCPTFIWAQNSNKEITYPSYLSRFSYDDPEPSGWALIKDGYKPFSVKVRAYLEGLLRDHKIKDKGELKATYRTLAYLDLQDGKLDSAIERVRQVRELESQPDLKLWPGNLFEVELIARAQKRSGATSGEAYRQTFRQMIAKSLNGLPPSFYFHQQIAGYIDVPHLFAWGYAEMMFEDILANKIRANGNKLNFNLAADLIAMMMIDRYFGPLANDMEQVAQTYLAAHHAPPKPNIWANRTVDLTGRHKLTPVVIAIWDTGVDPAAFPDRMFLNPNEKANGTDNDGNGFASDTHGIGFDEKGEFTPEPLFPMADADLKQFVEWTKDRRIAKQETDPLTGFDLPAAVQRRAELERLGNIFSTYRHGTASASIAVSGNPAARIMNARSTWRAKSGEADSVQANEEWARAFARNIQAFVDYFKKNNVRVVNIGWHITWAGIENNLRRYEKDEKKREIAADKTFEIVDDALAEAFTSAPDILFVSSAGDSYHDSDLNDWMKNFRFGDVLPSSMKLPNLITLGAVDTDGSAARFTTFDPAIDLYAQGTDVEATLPDGGKLMFEGSKGAAPQAANLAAKLFALNPKLTVAQVVKLIQKGADADQPDVRLKLINPKRSVGFLLSGTTR